MATATRQARTTRQTSRGALVAPEPEPMRFLIFEDNGGNYHWTLLARDGNGLVRSSGFASYRDAENAAHDVLAGAGSARLDVRVDTDSAVDNDARHDEVAAHDDTDAER